MGFNVSRLLTFRKGEQAKTEGEKLTRTRFGQWVIDHPIIP
jgi:hypothetical protein